MVEKLFPDVASFLIRFVQDQSISGGKSKYRGIIKHVQTENETFFTSWKEVEAFIQRVIPLEIYEPKIGEENDIEG